MLKIKSIGVLFGLMFCLSACTSVSSLNHALQGKLSNDKGVSRVNSQSVSVNMSAFPKASETMQRFVIILPQKDRAEERTLAIELEVGKQMKTDGINQIRGFAQIEKQILQGWGYSYFTVDDKSTKNVMSTKIGVPTGTVFKERYVPLGTKMIDYNSRLPIVIYAPKETDLRYRIWSANEEFIKAPLK